MHYVDEALGLAVAPLEVALDQALDHVGDVGGFAPPGDIHRVHNTGDTTAISIHIYGTDVTRTGSSVRRYYD